MRLVTTPYWWNYAKNDQLCEFMHLCWIVRSNAVPEVNDKTWPAAWVQCTFVGLYNASRYSWKMTHLDLLSEFKAVVVWWKMTYLDTAAWIECSDIEGYETTMYLWQNTNLDDLHCIVLIHKGLMSNDTIWPVCEFNVHLSYGMKSRRTCGKWQTSTSCVSSKHLCCMVRSIFVVWYEVLCCIARSTLLYGTKYFVVWYEASLLYGTKHLCCMVRSYTVHSPMTKEVLYFNLFRIFFFIKTTSFRPIT